MWGKAWRVLRERPGVAAISLFVLGATVTVLGIANASPAPGIEGSPKRVFAPKDCRQPRQEPSRIVIACADFYTYVHELKWKRWGGPEARGGELRAKVCEPNCADSSQWETYKVKVRLERIRPHRCSGARRLPFYRVMRLEFRNERPTNHARFAETRLQCI